MEEVQTVEKQMTLDVSCAGFDIEKVKQSLALQYNVDPSLITLENPCARRLLHERPALGRRALAGLTLTIKIASHGTTADGKAISAPPGTYVYSDPCVLALLS